MDLICNPGICERLYGEPVRLPGMPARNTFWPKHKAEFHVLFYTAIACGLCRPVGMSLSASIRQSTSSTSSVRLMGKSTSPHSRCPSAVSSQSHGGLLRLG